MQAVTTIGFDIAKSVFQVHGVDAAAKQQCGGWAFSNQRVAPGCDTLGRNTGWGRLRVHVWARRCSVDSHWQRCSEGTLTLVAVSAGCKYVSSRAARSHGDPRTPVRRPNLKDRIRPRHVSETCRQPV